MNIEEHLLALFEAKLNERLRPLEDELARLLSGSKEQEVKEYMPLTYFLNRPGRRKISRKTERLIRKTNPVDKRWELGMLQLHVKQWETALLMYNPNFDRSSVFKKPASYYKKKRLKKIKQSKTK